MLSIILFSHFGYYSNKCLLALSGEAQPECTSCQCPLPLKHILLQCVDFADISLKVLPVVGLTLAKGLSDNVNIRNRTATDHYTAIW